MTLRFEISGATAAADAHDLLSDDRLQGAVEVDEGEAEPTKEPLTLAAIASIIGAVGGIAAIVDSVLGWKDRLDKRNKEKEKPAQTVVIVYVGDHGHPLSSLDKATLRDLLLTDPTLDASRG